MYTKTASSITKAKQKLGDSLKNESPVPTKFKTGDKVIYTNDNGVKFELEILGFAEKPDCGRFVYIFIDCWWFPVKDDCLKIAT